MHSPHIGKGYTKDTKLIVNRETSIVKREIV
jgi:hypothetical protein